MASLSDIRDSIFARLRPDVRELVDAIGWVETVRLTRANGGKRLYVPEAPNGMFLRSTDKATRLALAKRYGGEYIHVPKRKTLISLQRKERICREYERAQYNMEEIATLFSVTRACVSQIVNEHSR